MTNAPFPAIDSTQPLKSAVMSAHDIAVSEYHRRCQLDKRAMLLNRHIIFDALNELDVHHLTITFDGGSDNGQIESIKAFANAPADPVKTISLPHVAMELWRYDHETADLSPNLESLESAVETLAYDLLEDQYGGWENNDGAFGDITLTVPARTITLNFNERFIDFTNTTCDI